MVACRAAAREVVATKIEWVEPDARAMNPDAAFEGRRIEHSCDIYKTRGSVGLIMSMNFKEHLCQQAEANHSLTR